MARQVLENGVILPAEYSDDWYDDMTSNLTKLDDVIGSDSEKLSSSDVGAAALSNNYNDLDNLPTIPTVNDATLTIQKNGVDVQTFTANASSNVTANITVPTKTSDLTNDSNFVDTSNSAVASGITSAKVTDYDSHIADTDIHVTTADKNKWNNQTYVFRYSSTALTPSSTNANSLLDNTDNLKVGDKVIDSSGVLFSITAIDTQNSTFTIGTALIDLAQDSDVVHKSGNETISGTKDFSDILRVYNSNSSLNTAQIWLKNSKVNRGQSVYGDQTIFFRDATDKPVTALISRVTSVGASALLFYVYNVDQNNQQVTNYLSFGKNLDGTCYLLPDQTDVIEFGSTAAKFKNVNANKFNGVEPSSLSLPSGTLTEQIDISSYFANTGTGDTNSYTASANGWIYLRLADISSCQVTIFDANNNRMWGQSSKGGIEQMTIPILKGQTLTTQWSTASSVNVATARFIPCQGNV